MMERMFTTFVDDIRMGREESPIFRHYLDQPMLRYPYSFELEFRPEDIAVDYIASMTDDYFVDPVRVPFSRRSAQWGSALQELF